jgi:hypothetical protein
MRLKNKILAFAITSLLFLFNLAKAVFANDSSGSISNGEISSSVALGNDDPQTIAANVANIMLGFSFIILLAHPKQTAKE